MEFQEKIDFCKKTAVEAGEKAMEFYTDEIDFSQKEDKSPLTRADVEANRIITTALREKFREIPLLTEEEADDKKRLEHELVWIIDPLDGTKDFIKKTGDFTVNIALVYRKRPVLGVIYVPVRKELYYAAEGFGSFIEREGKTERLTVSQKEKTEDMILVKSRLHSNELLDKISERFARTASAGSSLKGCLVAKGEADVYIRLNPINEWDICAMDIIVREAGGIMTDLKGKMMTYNNENTLKNGFFISNNRIHNQIKEIIDTAFEKATASES